MTISPTNDNDKKQITGTFKDSTSLLGKPEELRQRAEDEGMLFFRGLIPKEDILKVRMDIMQILNKYGLIDKNYDLIAGMADVEAVNRYSIEELSWNGVGVTQDMYREIQKLESFHALAHHVKLMSMYNELFGYAALPHPRNIGRIMLPHRDVKITPSHQDFIHIQGEEETWTCWIPLGDTPRELGGLAVLQGSHRAGLLGVTEDPGAGGLETILCGLDYDWHTVDYMAGDVLTFNSLTVHKSTPSRRPGQIRMSSDFRYQALKPTTEIESRSLDPHGPFTWDDLYEGWQSQDLQYYWKKSDFQFKPFDESLRWQKEKIC